MFRVQADKCRLVTATHSRPLPAGPEQSESCSFPLIPPPTLMASSLSVSESMSQPHVPPRECVARSQCLEDEGAAGHLRPRVRLPPSLPWARCRLPPEPAEPCCPRHCPPWGQQQGRPAPAQEPQGNARAQLDGAHSPRGGLPGTSDSSSPSSHS